jgi:hypothetical protein
MHADNSGALYTLNLEDLGAAAAEDVTHQSISACLDYVIWAVDGAASEEDLRAAKLLLERSIESYVDEVTARICGRTVDARA